MKLLLTFKESHCLGVRVGTLSLLNGSPGNVDGSDEHEETKINFWKKNLFHFLNHYCVLNNLC